MQALRTLIKNNSTFFIGYLVFILTGILLLLFFTKTGGFYFLNPYHHKLLNYIFYFFTFLGDGFFVVPFGLVFLFFKKRKLCLLIISSYLFSGIIAQSIKYFIVEARPAIYKGLEGYNNFIENVTLHNYHSFPSGHTVSAFALAMVLALFFNNKKAGKIFLLIAVLVGYSRIYIGQHFLIDVLAGSVIGVISGIICWMALYKRTWLL